ncbi:hypothetical protein [[Clostridium] polysaccharolyticum]|uniref:Uncharacterized protein n=1 Tax=[Clostridium] polysaccharolyticum TaxID=29364 RepID=A0A1H9YJM3_9FIRM|nr:hypothetical protein [[Clostridium] polysaccharolyticum]SES69200.1 hypothetical protein SAMN04487772_10252 [[Clostridium] polysaccharolyticum]
MEKFFIFAKDGVFYTEYMKYKEDLKANRIVFNNLREKFGIEATEYLPRKEYLFIVPTLKDEDKFNEQFTAERHDNGLRKFRRYSEVGKAWVRLVRDTKVPQKPNLFRYINGCGCWRERIFEIGDILYCSIHTDYADIKLDNDVVEMKASEFYKLIEDNQDGHSS